MHTLFPSLSFAAAQTRHRELGAQLRHHDVLYYLQDAPTLTDAAYDDLRRELLALEAAYPSLVTPQSPSQTVGANVAPTGSERGLGKYAHSSPMLSLDNAFSLEDMDDFLTKLRRFLNLPATTAIPLMAEPKIDGLSAALHYHEGQFVMGLTRGDGQEGEIITANLATIPSIPHHVKDAPPSFEVRGEVYMTNEDFQHLNQQRLEAGEPPFANPRNAAAGSLRQLDATVTAARPLHFFAYSLIMADHGFSTYNAQVAWLADKGFPVLPHTQLLATAEDIAAYYAHMLTLRPTLPYLIDGLVYKVNALALHQRLGLSARSPRWAIAQKFPAEQTTAVLEQVIFQVGRTGVITPVACLSPVMVGGVMVQRATLHNQDEVQRKDIRVGDTVRLQRAGDVIPQVVEVVLEQRPAHSVPLAFPTTCPECGSHLSRKEGYAAWCCTGGLVCPAQRKERLKHFVSRDALDIEGLGAKNVDFFFEEGRLTSPQDIFTLTAPHATLPPLDQLPGWGPLSVANLAAAVTKSKTVALERFIYALGIPLIGKVTAKALAQQVVTYTGFKAFCTALAQGHTAELLNLDGMGPSSLEALVQFWVEPHNQEVLEKLEAYLTIMEAPPLTTQDHPLTGKKIVFTGTLSTMGRQEAKTLAESLGAKVQSAVSAQTDYVVVGSDAGSKAKKAIDLGVRVLTEAQWVDLSS